ncbi:hypothetical protein HELRODRAFT_165246 [Helobdella robusta]|uniref:Uncharacterized protein n=1 Tax=Helobdella robusta TaxID=6412 RepID=T1EWH6_HELRO|nr:hypothetical protein HELRODRAFT_165246 [Helobdella robusta]ESN93086.1 hypothetical protein HELRODRAFT_165246 [Helobdella robusta]
MWLGNIDNKPSIQSAAQPLPHPTIPTTMAHQVTSTTTLSATTSTSSGSTTSNERCLYEPQPQGYLSEESFRYSINCSPEFPEAMRLCYKEFFNTRVVFHQSMLAVVKSSTEVLLGWCNSLEKYEQCLEPIEESCPEGIDLLYRLSFEWKKYYDIAIYICQRKEKYIEYLPCFNKAVHESSRPSLCRELLRRDYSDQYMYQLKCHSKNSSYTNSTLQEIDGLIKCFETFAIKACTPAGRDVIYPLIRLQYSFDYLPKCVKPRNKTAIQTKTTKRVRYSSSINSSSSYRRTTPSLHYNSSSVFPTPTCNCNCVCPEIIPVKSNPETSYWSINAYKNGCFFINVFTMTLSFSCSLSIGIM